MPRPGVFSREKRAVNRFGLAQIKEVKKYFDDYKQKYEQELATMRCQTTTKSQASGFPFSASAPPTKQEILSLFPAKPVVDLLVDTYFGNHEPLFRMRPSHNVYPSGC